MLASDEFRRLFESGSPRNAFVMSVDIRRSTELMLKAREAEQFAAFITGLCTRLTQIVLDSYGVFDKFSGDGILAFFPDFYSGEDAGYYAMTAAARCHKAFEEHYARSRTFFTSVLKDTGLGIGIDYGQVHLVQVAGGLTVVGAPVVYACRMGEHPRNALL